MDMKNIAMLLLTNDVAIQLGTISDKRSHQSRAKVFNHHESALFSNTFQTKQEAMRLETAEWMGFLALLAKTIMCS
jgi:hypothetical protein